jgi:hypothetical protein
VYRNVILAMTLALHSDAYAQFSMYWDVLDPSESADQPPESLVVLDLFFDVDAPIDAFNGCGIRAETREGARLVYKDDPNSPQAILTNPGVADRFVTFFSDPRYRFGLIRFTASRAYTPGGYAPTTIFQDVSANHVNVGFLSPPGERLIGGDGWIFRIALETQGTWFENRDLHPVQIFQGLPPDSPSEFVPILVSRAPGDDLGTVAATVFHSTLRGFDWWLGARVPEASTLALLVVGVFSLRRR